MKILSIAIPCYNSESYMEKCIKSILPVGDEVEILIVDDGSTKDRTPEIADQYEKQYPGIIRAIHQENGGHGEAVNAGLRNATGLYYKVCDSDDWLNTKGLAKIVKKLKELENQGGIDMMLANFIYDKVGVKHKKVMQFRHVFPQDRIFSWDDMKHMTKTQYLLMHNMIYRTELLREIGMVLPKHTFYVDNVFCFMPLPATRRLYYMDINLYHYFIGREDQSVNEKVMISRVDQQLRVNKIMIDVMAQTDYSDKSKRLKKYMCIYLNNIMTVSSILLILDGSKEAMEKKKEIWTYLKENYPEMYKKMRYSLFGMILNLPGKPGIWLSKGGYRIAHKLIGFN